MSQLKRKEMGKDIVNKKTQRCNKMGTIRKGTANRSSTKNAVSHLARGKDSAKKFKVTQKDKPKRKSVKFTKN
jgi:hypothetical protein